MRRFLLVVAVLAIGAVSGQAAWLTKEVSLSRAGTATTVSVSTSAWTAVPTSSSLNTRAGLMVDVPAGNTANMVGHLGSCSSTSLATTVRPLEFIKGDGFTFVPVDNGLCLWLLSLHTSAESVHVQEVGQ